MYIQHVDSEGIDITPENQEELYVSIFYSHRLPMRRADPVDLRCNIIVKDGKVYIEQYTERGGIHLHSTTVDLPP
jgi:hypothetical protein